MTLSRRSYRLKHSMGDVVFAELVTDDELRDGAPGARLMVNGQYYIDFGVLDARELGRRLIDWADEVAPIGAIVEPTSLPAGFTVTLLHKSTIVWRLDGTIEVAGDKDTVAAVFDSLDVDGDLLVRIGRKP